MNISERHAFIKMENHLLHFLYPPSTTTSIHLLQLMIYLKRLNQETEPYRFSHSSCSSSTSHQAGIDEEIKMLGRMTNIVFDEEGMEGSKSNPIIVYDSNNEPENGEGLIHKDKDVCVCCN